MAHHRYFALVTNFSDGVKVCPMTVDVTTREVSDEDAAWEDATCENLECRTTYTETTNVSAGTPCKFPFYEGNVLRWSCVTDDVWGTDPWCATSTYVRPSCDHLYPAIPSPARLLSQNTRCVLLVPPTTTFSRLSWWGCVLQEQRVGVRLPTVGLL
jgi:hypothetical protein